MQKKSLAPKPLNVDDASQDVLRANVEKQLQEVKAAREQEKVQTMALTTTEVKVKNSRGEGHRTMVKDTKTGRFVSTTTHRAQKDTMDAQAFLSSKSEDGKTVKQRLREHLANTALTATAEDLNAAVKAVEYLDRDAGYTDVRKKLLEADENKRGGITVIFTPPANVISMTQEEWEAHMTAPTKPAFIEGTVVQENPPRNLDTTSGEDQQ
jgi:hypothetical protein